MNRIYNGKKYSNFIYFCLPLKKTKNSGGREILSGTSPPRATFCFFGQIVLLVTLTKCTQPNPKPNPIRRSVRRRNKADPRRRAWTRNRPFHISYTAHSRPEPRPQSLQVLECANAPRHQKPPSTLLPMRSSRSPRSLWPVFSELLQS